MARKIQIIPFKRKKQGKTDYKKRLKLLLAGKPRLVIRKSLKNITAQVIEYKDSGDTVLVSSHSKNLNKLGWKMGTGNVPAAYLTGYLIGKKASEKKIGECVLDTGLYGSIKGSRIYAALKGAIDGGLKVPASEKIFPDEERIKGAHIAKYSKETKNKNQFSKVKKDSDPENITKQFEEVKQKIEGK